jgi:predicted enzyme related to lactoylglutathione lyase
MSVQGRIVWHDLMTTDVDSAKRFYGALFGWNIVSHGPWCFIYPKGDDASHFGTIIALEKEHGVPPHWQPYVAVKDLDGAAKLATDHGGKIVVPRQHAGTTGDFVIVTDPQGGVFTLWQYTGGGPKAELDGRPDPGSFCWDELMVPDPDAAARFYGTVAGWGAESVEMPDFGRYTLFLREAKNAEGKPRQAGGLMKLPPEVPHPMWLSYVWVADCDATLEEAKKLGATITSPPIDIPGVGRFTTLLDPQYAPIAVMGPIK